jgi:hypothetical protein
MPDILSLPLCLPLPLPRFSSLGLGNDVGQGQGQAQGQGKDVGQAEIYRTDSIPNSVFFEFIAESPLTDA